jgi:hypothetical protein
LRFASLLVYSPSGASQASVDSQKAMRELKNCRPALLARIVLRLKQQFEAGRLRDFLGPDVVLVPAPRRVPPKLKVPSWPAKDLCDRLVTEGLGASVELLLTRHKAVPKSALQRKGVDRPGPDAHAESIRATPLLLAPSRITIVDDVVTRGSTLLGCAWVLCGALPKAQVRGLAAVRTMSGVEIEQMLDVVEGGRIFVRGGQPHREP